MKVVRHRYSIDGKLYEDLSTLQDLKEGTVIETVLVVEELKEEDKSSIKMGGEKEEEKEEEQPKVGLTPDEEAELNKKG